MDKIIYFDNAATTFPKPESVYKRVDFILRNVGGNPGRAGHRMAIEANRVVLNTRDSLAKLFRIKDSSRIIFTSGTTEALNVAIKGFLRPGDHVVTTSIEHNAVTRPLCAMGRSGIEWSAVRCAFDGHVDPDDLRMAIKKNTTLLAICHASNVTGTINHLPDISRIARERGIKLLVDAAQTAGAYDIDVERDGIDLLACPGHKGLFGIQGTGFLYIAPDIMLETLKEGGTGGDSAEDMMPESLPERFEAGTLNTPGIGALDEGVRFIMNEGLESIRTHEITMTNRLLHGLFDVKGVTVYGPKSAEKQMAVVSFNLYGKDPSDVGFTLDSAFSIMSRVGLHCATSAHKTIGTYPQGTVRLSMGYFNTIEEVDRVIEAIRQTSAF